MERSRKQLDSGGYAQISSTTLDNISVRERNFNLDIANPNAAESGHRDPDELLALYEKERAAAAKVREQLKRALAEALEGTA